jgi:hypothetical protein
MNRSPHLIAAVVTIVAAVIFFVLKSLIGFQFGFRTYWPGFACLYLIAWYYGKVIPTAGKQEKSQS